MQRKRIFNLLSLVVNLSIVYLVVAAIWYNFRTDVVRDSSWFGTSGWECFRYFTVLSNALIGVASGITLFFNAKNVIFDRYTFPKWALVVKYVATTAVAVTFFTVIFFLGPLVTTYGQSYFSLFQDNNLFLHFVVPVLAMLAFVFLERGEKLPFQTTFFGLLPTLAYSVIYLVMVAFVGEANGGWPDFYGLTFGGQTRVIPLSMLAMYLATYLFAFLLWLAQSKFAKRVEL